MKNQSTEMTIPKNIKEIIKYIIEQAEKQGVRMPAMLYLLNGDTSNIRSAYNEFQAVVNNGAAPTPVRIAYDDSIKFRKWALENFVIPDNYKGKTAEQVWNDWDEGQRKHFLKDHEIEIKRDMFAAGEKEEFDLFEFVKNEYSLLPFSYKDAVEKHISEGQYGKGGPIKSVKKFTDFYLIVDMDERGQYAATVYDPLGKEVWEISSAEQMNELVEDGFLKYKADEDLDGLTKYLMDVSVIPKGSQIWSEQDFEKNVRSKYDAGGVIASTPDTFFKSVNVSALTPKAAEYLQSEILSDPDLALLSESDPDFMQIKKYMSENFPSSINQVDETKLPAPATAPTKADLEKRLKIIMLGLKKDPENADLKKRKKIIELGIKKAPTMARGGTIGAEPITTELTEKLAKEYARLLKRDLTDKQMQEVIAKNKTAEYANADAAHDYIDANMTMDEAFQNVMKREFIFFDDEIAGTKNQHEHDVDLINKAVSLVKSNNYYIAKKKAVSGAEPAKPKSSTYSKGPKKSLTGTPEIDKLCPAGTEIESFRFSNSKFDKASAKAWAMERKYRSNKIDDGKKKGIRIRVQPAGLFDKSSLKVIDIAEGVTAQVGKKK